MPEATIQLLIEVDPAAEPITGTLWHSNGTSTTFRGWLALTEAVEARRRIAREACVAAKPEPEPER
jgi:hypothetical protein